MKKVLFISNHDKLPDENYGFNHHLYQINEFVRLGYSVTCLIPSFNHFTKTQRPVSNNYIEINPNFRVKVLSTVSYNSNLGARRFLSYLLFSIRVLIYGLKQKKIKVLFLVLPSPFLDLVCVLLKKKLKAKLVVDFRDLWPELFEKYLKGIKYIFAWPIIKMLYFNRSLTFKKADVITAVSQKYLKIATKNNKKAFAEVINLGFDDNDPNFFPNINKDKKETLNVVYAGSLSHNYDVRCLLDVIRKIEENYSDKKIVFHIAGNGIFKQEFLEIQKEYINRVVYHGSLDKKSLYNLYNNMDVSLCIYHKDTLISFPAKLFELIFHNLPIVNSLEGEVNELIDSEEIGSNYIAGDVDSLLEAILSFYDDREKLDRFKNNMFKIKNDFSVKTQYTKFSKLISNLD